MAASAPLWVAVRSVGSEEFVVIIVVVVGVGVGGGGGGGGGRSLSIFSNASTGYLVSKLPYTLLSFVLLSSSWSSLPLLLPAPLVLGSWCDRLTSLLYSLSALLAILSLSCPAFSTALLIALLHRVVMQSSTTLEVVVVVEEEEGGRRGDSGRGGREEPWEELCSREPHLKQTVREAKLFIPHAPHIQSPDLLSPSFIFAPTSLFPWWSFIFPPPSPPFAPPPAPSPPTFSNIPWHDLGSIGLTYLFIYPL